VSLSAGAWTSTTAEELVSLFLPSLVLVTNGHIFLPVSGTHLIGSEEEGVRET
jgi:hypothetical protein